MRQAPAVTCYHAGGCLTVRDAMSEGVRVLLATLVHLVRRRRLTDLTLSVVSEGTVGRYRFIALLRTRTS